jgi:hypothetical protein
MDEFFD